MLRQPKCTQQTPLMQPAWNAYLLILIDISVHQQQEVCNREAWGWGVAYQLETWWCRLDVTPPQFCYNKVLRINGCLLLTLLICYVVTPTLKVLQKVLKCDVTLLSIYNSDWSQKGKFNSCNIITLYV
jgi:hypothetical protein